MNRTAWIVGLSVSTSAIAVAGARDAAACGGCFHPPAQTVSDITDERMLLSVSTLQSTLYDQLRYTGSPANFAWVLPIHGIVDVGLSADVLFDSIDVLTETRINPPAPNCPSPNCRFFGPTAAGGSAGGDAGESVVTVTKQENVGPYATVQLHSTDSSALDNWLAQNGYNVPADVAPVIAEYVAEGFDFLAMKLLPNQGVQAMRPVRITTPGAGLSLPLRMAAVGTGPEVGISIWVVADGRYEPQNFPFFHIDDSALVWDFATSQSNYTTLRVQNEANLKGKGWEIESSISLNEQTITNVILSGGQYYGGGFGGGIAAPADPSLDYLPVGSGEGGAHQTAEEVRTADVNALFAGMTGPNVRITRIRSDILHTAMTADFVLQASSDQSELSNVRNVTQSVNLSCPLYNGCQVIGTGTPAQAAASIAGSSGQSGSGAASGSAASGSVSTSGSAASGSVSTSGTTTSGSAASGSVSTSGSASSGAITTSGSSPPGSGQSAHEASSAGGGGCVAAAQSNRGSAAALGGMAALLGLFATRALRARRRRTGS